MRHFVTEMCTCSVTKWCIVGCLADALWDLWNGSFSPYDTEAGILKDHSVFTVDGSWCPGSWHCQVISSHGFLVFHKNYQAVFETKASLLVRDQQLLVRTSSFFHIFIFYKLMFIFLKILIRTGNFFSLVLNTATRALFQYPITCDKMWVKTLKVRDRVLKCLYRFEIWQAHWQRWCQGACQISERLDISKYKSHSFKTVRSYDKMSYQILKQGPASSQCWDFKKSKYIFMSSIIDSEWQGWNQNL